MTINIEEFNHILQDPRNQVILGFLIIWSLIFKGIALWRAARNHQRNWFIAFLVVNTLGILEIIYIFYFSKKKDQ